MKNGKTIILLIAMVFIVDFTFSQGCSQCKMLAEQGSELDEASFGTNINYGILYLMVIPYLAIMFLFRKRIADFFKKKFSKA